MGLLKRILGQCKKPGGWFGRFLLRVMNFGHSGLTKWGLGFIDIAGDINVLDIGCGGGKTVKRLAETAIDGSLKMQKTRLKHHIYIMMIPLCNAYR